MKNPETLTPETQATQAPEPLEIRRPNFALCRQLRTIEKDGKPLPHFMLKGCDPQQKGTNYAIIVDDTFRFQNAQSSFAILEPANLTKKEVWIIQVKTPSKTEHRQAIDDIETFLAHGYAVLFVYGDHHDLRQALRQTESRNYLHYQNTTNKKIAKDFQGLDVTVYDGITLVADSLRMLEHQGVPFAERTLDKVQAEFGMTVTNTNWASLADIEKRNSTAILPLQAFGELAPLIADIKLNSNWTDGMIVTAILGILGGVLRSYHTTTATDPENGEYGSIKPLLMYTCIGANANTGKDELTNYLMHPINLYQKQLFSDYNEYKKHHPQAVEPLPHKPFISNSGSIKGLIKALARDGSMTVANTEARIFFSSFGGGEQMQQSLGILSSFWTGQPQDYLTKDEQVRFDPQTRLSLYLMTQNDDFANQINQDEFWLSGLFNRFLLHSEPPPDYNNLRATTLDYDSEIYETYCHKIALMLSDNIDDYIILPADCNQHLGKLSIAYLSRKGDKYPHHQLYNNDHVGGFIGRAYELILRIASILLVYEKIQGKLKPTKYDSLFWHVEYSDDKKECWITDLPRDNPQRAFNTRQKLTLTMDYIHRAEQIFEFYVQNLIFIMRTHSHDNRIDKILNKVYEMTAGGETLTFSELKRVRPLRDTRGGTGSAPVAEYWEVLDMLVNLGYIQVKGPKNEIKIHPEYKPNRPQ